MALLRSKNDSQKHTPLIDGVSTLSRAASDTSASSLDMFFFFFIFGLALFAHQRAEELRRAQEEKLERKDALIQKIRADKERERQMRIFRSQLAMERKKKQAERLHIAQQRKVQALERQVGSSVAAVVECACV